MPEQPLYYARFRNGNLSDGQSVEDHLEGVAKRIDQFFINDREKPIPELERLARLASAASRLHDVGKFSNDFQEYIKSEDEAFKRRMRGIIDHATAADNTFFLCQID